MLSQAEIDRFAEQGYLTGLPLCSAEHMSALRPLLDSALGVGVERETATLHRHLDLPAVYELGSHPAIVERVASLLGPDILLWHSRFFDKPPGEPPVPWHQDAPFWRLDPMDCVSAWIAIDATGPHNGCMEVIPGSHREPLPHIMSEGTGRFGIQTKIGSAEESRAVAIPLEAGQFILFDRWLLHRSAMNTSTQPRVGLSLRFTTPGVRVDCSRFGNMTPPYGVHLVRGEDRFGYNPIAPAPAGAGQGAGLPRST